MLRLLIPLALAAGCKDAADDSALETPTLSFLAPVAGSTLDAGAVSVSLVVEHFILVEPTASRRDPADRAIGRLIELAIPAAQAHTTAGTPEGYVALGLDGVEVLNTGSTQVSIEQVLAGEHTLDAELRHSDGDAFDPPIVASVSFTTTDP